MTASPRAYPRLLPEAASLSTPGPRLAQLARHRVPEVATTARRNPGLPDATLQFYLAAGDPSAWANPLATFAVLDKITPGVQAGACRLICNGSDATEVARQVARGWWANETAPDSMLEHLASQATWHQQTPIHRRAVGALCACLRWAAANRALSTAGRLDWIKPDERLPPVVDAFERWAAGGDRPLVSFEIGGLRRTAGEGLISGERLGCSLFGGVLARAVLPLGEPRPVATRVEVATSFVMVLDAPLADVLRAAIPDPTEGLG